MNRDDADQRPPRHPSRGPKPSSASGDDSESLFQPAPAVPRRAGKRRGTPARSGTTVDRDRTPPEKLGRPRGPSLLERVIYGRVSSVLLARFCRQLAGYLQAGVDLLKSLESLENQFRGSAMGPVIGRVGRSIQRGDGLADAIARDSKAFDPLVRSMVRVAEARGAVPETLREIAELLENRVRLLRKARSALIYPTAVILIAALVGWLLTVFVLPPLIGILEDMTRGKAVTLPLPTRILMGMSHFMASHGWWAVPTGALLGILGLSRLYRVPGGRALMDALAIRLPVFGPLLRKIETVRFARTLSTLLGAGVDFDQSIRLTVEVLQTTPFRRAVARLRAAVAQGDELSAGVEAIGLFDVDVPRVIETGEETGKLPETLGHLAEDYQEQVERTVDNLGHLLQPVLTILIGGFVFFIALAFVMAYITLIGDLASGF